MHICFASIAVLALLDRAVKVDDVKATKHSEFRDDFPELPCVQCSALVLPLHNGTAYRNLSK